MDFPANASQATLSPGGRIRRGFRRMAYATAVVSAAVGVTVSFLTANESAESDLGRYRQAVCLNERLNAKLEFRNPFNPATIDVDKSGCPGYWLYSPTEFKIYKEAIRPKPNVAKIIVVNAAQGITITALITAILYWFFAGLGWILAGFARDEAA